MINRANGASRISAFDQFRGIAIVFIIAGHCYGPWAIDTFAERTLANLITGGTAYFVFISGFFLHHVFYQEFRYRSFILKKVRFILLPYLIMSTLGIAYFLGYLHQPPLEQALIGHPASGTLDYLSLAFFYYLTGGVMIGYWYVPFIMVIFLLSPLFIAQINLPQKTQTALLIASFFVAMLVHRPNGNLSPLHSAIYFYPLYTLGMIVSVNRERALEILKGKALIFGSLALILASAQAFFVEGVGNFYKTGILSYAGVDILILQKTLMCLFFVSLLHQYESRPSAVLKYLASISFALYFIHPWILQLIGRLSILEYIRFLPGAVFFGATTLLTIGGSLAVAHLIKALLGNRSRTLIGW